MLSKTVAVTLPGALLVILWWKRRLAWRSAVLILPYLALGLPLAVFAVWMQHVHTGASGEEFHLTVVQRLMIASRAPWFYLSKLVWPWPLAFVYPKWELKTWHLVGGAATVGVLIVLWALRNRIGRGPLAAFLIYGGMLLPALGFFNVFWFRYTWVADHVQYHASVAMYALLAAALLRWWPRVIDPPVPLGAWLLTLCLFTVGLSTSYYDNERLMRRTAKFNPHNQFPHGNLGYALHAKGKYAEAAEAFREALKYTPPVPYRVSRAQYWLGHALESDRRFAEAIPPYREAVKADPEYASAHYNLANCLRETRQFEEAADHYRRTIQIEPGHVYAHNNLAFSLLMAGRVDEAIAEYEATLRIAPGLAPAQAGLRQAQLRKQNESR